MSNPRFIVQKHDASSLHYDFRLEVDGTLKSWAVPKGFSTDPADKRLAIQVDDHDLAAYDFEGVIPEDDYGGGTVLIWDRGTYENMSENEDGDHADMKDGLDDGHLAVKLHGEKLQGGYALTRIRNGEKPQWLLVKIDDDQADARRNPVSTEPDSVVSGRSIDDIADEEDPTPAKDIGN